MNACNADTYAIILAAGASRRLGSPKQLALWHDKPLLEHAIDQALTLLSPGHTFVMLGANAETIEASIDLSRTVPIFNPDWQEGIASSIRSGIAALPSSTKAVLILLCDQPLINNAALQTLLTAAQNSPTRIIASHYHQSAGVPAVFPAQYFSELLNLQGDRGAKAVLLKFTAELITIPLPQAEFDIDTRGDLES
jgi:molybdenum cofactor cytidylyltransferase